MDFCVYFCWTKYFTINTPAVSYLLFGRAWPWKPTIEYYKYCCITVDGTNITVFLKQAKNFQKISTHKIYKSSIGWNYRYREVDGSFTCTAFFFFFLVDTLKYCFGYKCIHGHSTFWSWLLFFSFFFLHVSLLIQSQGSWSQTGHMLYYTTISVAPLQHLPSI